MRIALRVLLAATALALPISSVAATETTAPAKTISILVVISDKQIEVVPARGSTSHNGSLGPTPISGSLPRGDYVSITVLNTGKKVHDFSIFGKQTKPIKPGGKAHLFADAITRGTHPWESTLDKGKNFHGSIIVA